MRASDQITRGGEPLPPSPALLAQAATHAGGAASLRQTALPPPMPTDVFTGPLALDNWDPIQVTTGSDAEAELSDDAGNKADDEDDGAYRGESSVAVEPLVSVATNTVEEDAATWSNDTLEGQHEGAPAAAEQLGGEYDDSPVSTISFVGSTTNYVAATPRWARRQKAWTT